MSVSITIIILTYHEENNVEKRLRSINGITENVFIAELDWNQIIRLNSITHYSPLLRKKSLIEEAY